MAQASFAASFLVCAVIASSSVAQNWYTFNAAARSCESDVVKLTHGKPPSGYWGKGIIEFRHKAWDINFGYTLDCFGCGSAKYDRTGPSTYELSGSTKDYVDVHVKYTDCVTVDKIERLYRGVPVLEINYARVNVLWFEDFWDIKGADPVYAMYGVSKEINRSEYGTLSCKPQNFGDCFIKSLGSTVEACTYKNHLIFGTHSKSSGRGIGEVYPVSMGVRDWKIWWSDRSVANYEVFPAVKTNQKRWIFIYEGARNGLIAMGKSILDNGGKPATTFTAQKEVAHPAKTGISLSNRKLVIETPQGQEYRMSVSDLNGRTVLSGRFHGAGRHVFGLNDLTGTYVVSLVASDGSGSVRRISVR